MTQVKFNRRPFEGSFNNFVDDFFAGLPVFHKNGHEGQSNGFVPVNIKETEKSYDIDVVAPGFDKTDFKVNVEENILTISAEKKNELKEATGNDQQEKQVRKEYSFRSFKRSFTLDDKIDAAGIEAKYVNGILTLNLPRKAEVKPAVKQISIQ